MYKYGTRVGFPTQPLEVLPSLLLLVLTLKVDNFGYSDVVEGLMVKILPAYVYTDPRLITEFHTFFILLVLVRLPSSLSRDMCLTATISKNG